MRWGPHVSGSSCHVSAVDFGQRGQLGPLGSQAVTQGVGPCVPAQQSRRSSSGELARSGRTPASVGIHLRGTKSGAGRLSGTASSRRVRWRGARRRGWPEWSPATSAVDGSSGADGDRATGRSNEACLGPNRRVRRGASNGGGGLAGNSRRQRWREAERTPEFGCQWIQR